MQKKRGGLLASSRRTLSRCTLLPTRMKKDHLRDVWKEKVEKPAKAAGIKAPRLEQIDSPYRQVYEPILNFADKVENENPDRIIAIVVPEMVEPHWYEYWLHNLRGAGLRARLYLKSDERIVVVSTPWRLRDM